MLSLDRLVKFNADCSLLFGHAMISTLKTAPMAAIIMLAYSGKSELLPAMVGVPGSVVAAA